MTKEGNIFFLNISREINWYPLQIKGIKTGTTYN